MSSRGYKKYMKKDVRQEHPLMKIFVISFFSTLLLATFVINSFAKRMTVDTSVGDYKEQQFDEMEDKKIVDMNRLEMIQNEDQGRNFSDLMQNASDVKTDVTTIEKQNNIKAEEVKTANVETKIQEPEPIYKVFIGSYTTAEQAKVAKEIIQESGSGLSPIVKCIGSNDYTLQVGIFKNKQSAEALLSTIQKNNLPGRIVNDTTR